MSDSTFSSRLLFCPPQFELYTNCNLSCTTLCEPNMPSAAFSDYHEGVVHQAVSEKLNSKTENDTDVLETVLSHVSGLGWYQKLLVLGMMLIGWMYGFVYFVQMFLVLTPQNHWCRVPELANLSMELRRNLSSPGAATGEWNRCNTFNTNWTRVLETLAAPPPDTPLVPCKHGWEFQLTDVPYETIVTERGWVCDYSSIVPTAQSMYFVGSAMGTFIFGWMANRFGRVPALVGAHLIAGVGGIATIFTTGVWDFILCRFIVGLAVDNCFLLFYMLVHEYVGPSHRAWVDNFALTLHFGGAGTALPWIALYIADWRVLLWVTSLPMFIVLLAPWLMPESTRWLVSMGRVNDAVKVLRRFETINKVKIPDDVMDEFIISSNKVKLEDNRSIFTLLETSSLRKAMLALVVVYCACAVVFDGLVRLCDSFGVDFFMTFSIITSTELPVILIALLLNRLGRRNSTWGLLTICGLLTFLAPFVHKGIPQAAFAISARFCLNMCFTAALQWSTEILPTPFKTTGLAVLRTSGFIVTIVAPFIAYFGRYWSKLPLLTFAVISMIAAAVSLSLPETNGQPMTQTIADTEQIIKEQSLCGNSEDADEAPYERNTSAANDIL